MKKALLLLVILLSFVTITYSQTIGFHESFELPSIDDSVSYTSTPTATYIWNINTRVHHGASSLRSDSCQVKAGSTVYMTTNAFSTVGNTFVVLSFSQICKVDFLDIATLEASNDGGTTWTQLTGAHYTGTGQYAGNGNRFASNSYGNLWVPGTPAQLPGNTWWRTETFDISVLLANSPNCKIRFKLADGGTVGPNNNKGWFIDNIVVTMSPSELIPPVIVLANPILTGTIWNIGPFNIKAKVTDQSGIDTAFVVYSVNGGTDDTVGMIHLTGDTMKGIIPAVNDSDQVCWRVEAIDNSIAHNWARNPVNTCNLFTARAGITFPFYDNYNTNLNLWTPSYGGTNQQSTWEWGTPAYGLTNSSHSPPYCWDVNLNTGYQSSAYCILTSPVFDFTNAVDARLSFWINYNTEPGWDGIRVEYTTDGTNWNTLGVVNDPLGKNWYTGILSATNQPGWAGNSEGWIKVKYKLSLLNNVMGTTRFRFVYNSDGSVNGDGFSIDDFSITLPSPQEIAGEAFILPNTGCGLGNETVKISLINTGLTPITNGLTAGYKKNAITPAVTETINATIQPGDTLIYTFVTPVNLSTVNTDVTYNLKAWVSLLGDPNHDDDTIFKTIVSNFVPTPPGVVTVTIPYGNFTTITATSIYPVTWYDLPVGGTLLSTNPSYTTPILYGTTIYYPEVIAPNGCISQRATDTVIVGQAPPNDGAAILIIAPTTGNNLTNSMTVKTRIRNYGTQVMTTFQMSYKVNNNNTVTENVTNFNLAPGDTITYTFTTPVNLVVYTTYHLKSWITQAGDNTHLNDTCTKEVENQPWPYCISSATWTDYGDIGNVTISNLNNGNPLPNVNNFAAQNLYTDFTSLNPVYLLKGNTYNVSITQTNVSSTPLEHYCKIFVDWNWNGTFEEATETAFSGGPTNPSTQTLTGQITVPLTAHEGYTRFRIVLQQNALASDVHPCGTYNYGETEDYTALISPQIPHDAGISSIISPATTYPQGLNTQPEFNMVNFGTEPITSVEVKYQIDNNPVVSQTWIGNLATSLSTTVTFPSIVLPTGTHTFCAWTVLTDDTNTINDQSCRNILGVPVDTLPYYDNFDGVVKFTTTTGSATEWVHGSPAANVFPDPPHSAPNVWATNLPNGNYNINAHCFLTSQIFDFTHAINAKLSFWYNSSTYQYADGTQVQYSTDGGNNWNPLGIIGDPLAINWYNYNIYGTGPAFTGTSNGWVKATYLLSNFNLVPTMRFRFLFSTGTYALGSGFAIDDFTITIPYHKDAGVDSIMAPQGQAVAYTTIAPFVRIVNFGMDTLDSLNVTYSVNGAMLTTQTWYGTLNPGASTNFQFTIPYTVPQGSYTLKVYSQLPFDGDHVNDTTRINLFGIPTFSVPYVDDFDSTLTYWYGVGSQWEHGPPTSSIINYALSPPYCWKTNLDGNYSRTGVNQYLYSPMFDFTVSGYDSLIFQHWVDIYPDEGGHLEYLSNTGWTKLGWMGDINAINWYTNNDYGWSGTGGVPGWHKSAYDLTTLTDFATPTQFRYVFTVIYDNLFNHNGWAIDNFELTSPRIPKDAGVVNILAPVGQTIYGTDMTVTVRIKNFGIDTLTYIPVKYQIDGITVNASVWTGSLLPDSTAVFSLPPYPSPLHNFTICAYTDVPLDVHYGNDTTCANLLVIPPDYDLTVTQITTPVFQTIHGDSATVKIIVKNLGLNPVTDIPVTYTVADTMIIIHENFIATPPIQPGDSATYTFVQKYGYEYLGYYYLCASADYPNDGYKANDTLCKKLEELWTSIPENNNDPLYLSQNIPNPGDDQTQIMFRLPKSGQITIEVVNMMGQKIKSIQDKMGEGEHMITLDTRSMLSGVYYYYLVFDQRRLVRKMVITH